MKKLFAFATCALMAAAAWANVIVNDMTLPRGESGEINLLHAVQDPDNMAALAVTTAQSSDESIARVRVVGLRLEVEAVAPGSTTVTVTTDSNGQLAQTTFEVTVTGYMIGDVNMDGKVGIDDVTALIDILLGSVLTDYDMDAADVDMDGRLTINDVTALIDMLLNNN